jgi:hypothetical protein
MLKTQTNELANAQRVRDEMKNLHPWLDLERVLIAPPKNKPRFRPFR